MEMKSLLLLMGVIGITNVFSQEIPEKKMQSFYHPKKFSSPSLEIDPSDKSSKADWVYMELANDPVVIAYSIAVSVSAGIPIPPVIPTKIGLGYRSFHDRVGYDISGNYHLIGGYDFIGNSLWNKKQKNDFLFHSITLETSFLPVLYKNSRYSGSFFFPFKGCDYLIYAGPGMGVGIAQSEDKDDEKIWIVHPTLYAKIGVQFNPYSYDKHRHHFDIKVGSPTILSLEYGFGF